MNRFNPNQQRKPIFLILLVLSCIALQAAIIKEVKIYQSKVFQSASKAELRAVNGPIGLSGNLVTGSNLANKAQIYNPLDGYAIFHWGMAKYIGNDFKAAIDAFQRAIPVLPHAYNAIRQLSSAYYLSGQYESAAQQFDRYIRLNPSPMTSPDTVFQMAGVSHLRIGNFAKAQQYLQSATYLTEQPANYYRIRAMVSILMNEPWTADYNYRAFSFKDPTADFNPMELVTNAVIANKLPGAIQFLEDIRKINKDDESIIEALAVAYGRDGHLDKSVQLLNESIQANPSKAELHLILGDLYYSAKKFEDAFREYDVFLKMEPDSPLRKEILRKKATTH